MLCVLKRTVSLRHWDDSFEYPQHMLWLSNKNIIFLVHTTKDLRKILVLIVKVSKEGSDEPVLFTYSKYGCRSRLTLKFRPLSRLDTSVLLDFSLTVKAATLIFISGCGSAISSANAQVTHSGITSPVPLRIKSHGWPRKCHFPQTDTDAQRCGYGFWRIYQG